MKIKEILSSKKKFIRDTIKKYKKLCSEGNFSEADWIEENIYNRHEFFVDDDKHVIKEIEENYYREEMIGVRESINQFKKEFDIDWARDARLEFLRLYSKSVKYDIWVLEKERDEYKKKYFNKDNEWLIDGIYESGGIYLSDKENLSFRSKGLKRLKNEFKKIYLEFNYLNAAKKNKDEIGDGVVDRCRDIPISQLFDGQLFDAGYNRHRGICPFHREKTGSFFIFGDNSYHCFGCNENGQNAIDFIMKRDDKPFIEAVRYLSNM